MEAEVIKEFEAVIMDIFKEKRDLQRFFLQHPRRQLFITNLCEQIDICEKRAYKITFEVREYKKTIRDMTKMFCQACLTHAEQKNMSESQRFAEERRLNAQENAVELIKDMVQEGLIQDNDNQQYKLGADDAPSEAQDETGA